MSMGKTYFIRKVWGGGGSSRTLKEKKGVLVSFPHSATPLHFGATETSPLPMSVPLSSEGFKFHIGASKLLISLLSWEWWMDELCPFSVHACWIPILLTILVTLVLLATHSLNPLEKLQVIIISGTTASGKIAWTWGWSWWPMTRSLATSWNMANTGELWHYRVSVRMWFQKSFQWSPMVETGGYQKCKNNMG